MGRGVFSYNMYLDGLNILYFSRPLSYIHYKLLSILVYCHSVCIISTALLTHQGFKTLLWGF